MIRIYYHKDRSQVSYHYEDYPYKVTAISVLLTKDYLPTFHNDIYKHRIENNLAVVTKTEDELFLVED